MQSRMHRGFPIKEGDTVTVPGAQPVASRDAGNIFRRDPPPPLRLLPGGIRDPKARRIMRQSDASAESA